VRILLTNDDGIHAEGLAVLERIARKLSDDIWVVAPEIDQSGFAHSLSISDPLRLRQLDERHFAVRGTPTDCVVMGCRMIMPGLPDLVLSGVNSGSNLADDVTYSGTVAGAMEGALVGIRSIALSQAYNVLDDARVVPWDTVEALAPALLEKLISMELPPGVFLNVNFPNCPPEEVEGTAVTSQGRLMHGLWIEQRRDGRGFPYYWMRFGKERPQAGPGSDLAAMQARKISVTPLKTDLTAHEVKAALAEVLA
jgi:5'-nucleotidase